MQPHEQARHRVEQPDAIARQAGILEQRAVGQGGVEVTGHEQADVLATLLPRARMTHGDDRRQPAIFQL